MTMVWYAEGWRPARHCLPIWRSGAHLGQCWYLGEEYWVAHGFLFDEVGPWHDVARWFEVEG